MESKLSNTAKHRLADLGLFFCAIVWGFSFSAVKYAVDYFHPFYLMAIRFSLAGLFSSAVLYKQLKHFTWKDFKFSLPIGLLTYLSFAAQTVGVKYTTVAKQGVLTTTYVILVPLIGVLFLHKRLNIKILLASIITMVGIYLLCGDGFGDFSLNKGDALTLLCAVGFAVQIILIEIGIKSINPSALAIIQLPVAATLFWITAFAVEEPPVNIPWMAWAVIIALSILGTSVCYFIQINAQRHCSPARASIIMSFESLFAVLAGVLLMQEKLNARQIPGIILLFSAIILIELPDKAEKQRYLSA